MAGRLIIKVLFRSNTFVYNYCKANGHLLICRGTLSEKLVHDELALVCSSVFTERIRTLFTARCFLHIKAWQAVIVHSIFYTYAYFNFIF